MKNTMTRISYLFNSVMLVVSVLKQMEYDICRMSTDDLWFYDVTSVVCYEECRMRPACLSFNMHAETHSCYLNMITPEARESCPGFLHTEKAALGVIETPECAAAQCHVTQMCVPRENGVACEYRECPRPSAVQNGHVLGNQRYVGARISILCDYSYRLVGPMSLMCGSNGAWGSETADDVEEVTSPQCLQECPEPEPLEHATIEGSGRVEGSTIVYVCDERYITSGTATYTCQPDGTWSPDDTSDGIVQTTFECLPGCELPPDIPYGTRNADQRVVGSDVTYSCHENYNLVGPASFTCNTYYNWTAVGGCSKGLYGNDLMTSPPKCLIENCIVKPEEAYQVHSDTVTWDIAAETCAIDGGHLVSFSCEEEFLFVNELIQQQEEDVSIYYTGLNDLDHYCYWAWRDSTDETTFLPWNDGEPNNYRNNDEHCGVLYRDRGSVMNDANCGSQYGFVCEFETTLK